MSDKKICVSAASLEEARGDLERGSPAGIKAAGAGKVDIRVKRRRRVKGVEGKAFRHDLIR